MTAKELAKEIFENYPKGIKIWQLQEECKYFQADVNEILKELCRLGAEAEESDLNNY